MHCTFNTLSDQVNLQPLSTMFASFAASLLLLVQLLACRQTACVKLDNKFFDLFSLSHLYEELKYGEIAQLRDIFLTHHLSEDTARLLYLFARAFVRTQIESLADYRAAPHSLSGVEDNACENKKRYDDHILPDIECHFNLLTLCVEGALLAPDSCLHKTPDHATCSQSKQCSKVYAALLLETNPAWLQLWASDTLDRLKEYQSKTPDQIAQEPKKTCLHDSQFLSAVFNLAICSEISRQVSFTNPREAHPLAEIFCPDPCLKSPCSKPHLKHQLVNTVCTSREIKWESHHAIAHRWDHLKLQLDHRVRPQYTCNCRLGSSWVAAKEACEREEGGSLQTCSPTLANKHFPCDLSGTSVCFDNKGSEEMPFICRCKLGYAGILCQELINPCIHKSVDITLYGKTQKMTGNRICNVNNAGESINRGNTTENLCTPAPDTRHGFSCTCNYPYYQVISLETDNCLGVSRACDARLCLNGDCVSTPDFVTASGCHCHPGWGGPHCNLTLEEWGIWTSCQPVCGSNRTRTRSRLGDRVDSTRLFKEIEMCPNRNCRDDTDDEEYSAYQTLLYASAADSGALTACLLIAGLMFALLRFWRPRFASEEARKA